MFCIIYSVNVNTGFIVRQMNIITHTLVKLESSDEKI